ncbi:MAG: ribosome maturation factor RimP [Lachnospiraceae bacterium]|nr:ribosome maturation factor RimP [Lachnospiraceae bacterium]
MKKSESYEARTTAILEPIAQANNLEIVDVEFVKEAGTWYLRAYLDKEGGINIDDCEVVSRALSDVLDAQDFIEESYILEVSSPGLDRPLKKEKDFERSLGKDVEVRTFKAVDDCKEFVGELKAYDADTVTIVAEDKEIVFDRKNIALIRLSFDFEF